jgi:putative DNA primase/helicase
LWMRACWREGIVPLLQMHDALDCSVTTREQGELVARLGCEAVKLEVPMRADLKFGKSWGDATHSWDELHGIAAPTDATKIISTQPEIGFSDRTNMPNDSDFRTSDLPNGSTSEHNLAAAENGANGVAADELPPWASTPEPARICAHCHLDPPDGSERPSAYGELWLHARCEDAFICARMAEEGLASCPSAPHSSGNGRDKAAANDSNTRDRDGYPWGEREVGSKAAEFIYRDTRGAPYLKVVKRVTKKGKAYPQYHMENGLWEKGKPNGPVIPYRLPELLAAPPNAAVWIPEGEQCADTLAALGLIATTNPGGAGKWTPELNKWLAGFQIAYVCEDNDAAGREHVSKVTTVLNGTVPDIRVLSFRELREHGDVKDWLDAGGTLEQLLERAKQAPKFAALECVCAADVESKAYDWIWPGRFALGKIGLLVGLPDEGKGLAFSDIIARITRGAEWPCGEGHAPLGNVILFTAEDDLEDTIKPRLMAADADTRRVQIVKLVYEVGKKRMFSLITDIEMLRQKVVEIGDVKMILIDPITAYLGIGKMDSFRTTDVRAVLGPLKEFAEELHVTILAIMHFNKKIDITNVLLRISDSLAYGAVARHAYAIVDDSDNDRKLFVKGKNNLAPHDQKTLAFSFGAREVGTDKKTGAQIVAPHIIWHTEPVDITALEAMQAAAESKSPSARDDAKQFLEALVTGEPVNATDVQEAAKANGISPRTLRRAKDDLGIDIKRDGPIVNGVHTWRWHPAEKPKENTND